MSTFSIAIMEKDPGSGSMTEAWKVHLFGQIKRLANLDFGLHNNQTTGATRTVYTLLARSMGTLGMMYHAINASTILVLQVIYLLAFKLVHW